MPGTNAWFLISPVVDVACRLGLDRRLLMQRLGVRGEPGEIRVAIERVFELWAAAARTLRDPSLPMRVGHAVRLDDLQLMGFAIMTASTGHEALAQAIRYAPLLTDSGRWRADTAADRVTVSWTRDGDRSLGHRIANEAGLAQFVGCMRQICGPGFAPSEVHFRHAAPDSLAAHRAFFRCPIEFGRDADAFWFERRALDVVPTAANPALAAFVREHADARLRTFTASAATQTRDAIDRALRSGDRPTADAAALALGMSERTLRRRLRDDGISFSALVDETLRDRAHVLVTQTTRSLTEIAIELGFSDSSAFSHAFRRWFHCAPRDLRRAA